MQFMQIQAVLACLRAKYPPMPELALTFCFPFQIHCFYCWIFKRPFVVPVAFPWKLNNNLKNPKAHGDRKELTSPTPSHSAILSSTQPLIIPAQSPATYWPSETPVWSVTFPQTFVHSKYRKWHQAAWWFYGISLNTEPTVNIRLQTIPIPGKHGYKPDSSHDLKTGFTEQVVGLRLKISNYCSLTLFFFSFNHVNWLLFFN